MPLLARTIVLNCGHNAAKKLFSNPKDREHEVIKTLCAMKAMMTWHAEKVGTVTRERCGGAAYLVQNVCGEQIWGAHSGMTAEGDNSVLMQKVVKDILSHGRKKIHRVPYVSPESIRAISKLPYISSAVTLKNLIYLKEQVEIKELVSKMKEMVFEKGEEFYSVWTKMVSDEIVNLSMSFSERFVLEEAMKVIEIECVHPGALRIMGHVIYLHMITVVKSNLAFYLEREIITREAAKNLDASY